MLGCAASLSACIPRLAPQPVIWYLTSLGAIGVLIIVLRTMRLVYWPFAIGVYASVSLCWIGPQFAESPVPIYLAAVFGIVACGYVLREEAGRH